MGEYFIFEHFTGSHFILLKLGHFKTIFKPRAKSSYQGPSSSQQLEGQTSHPSHSTQNATVKLGSPRHRF